MMSTGYKPFDLRVLAVALGCLLSGAAAAAPDRESLIEAWVAHMQTASGTLSFERSGEDTFRLRDDSLPYDGEVRIVGALVRPTEVQYVDSAFTHMGSVEFNLVTLADDRRYTQTYSYWMADRQLFYYSETEAAWLGQADYALALQEEYGSSGAALGPLSFMLNYGIWIALLALLVWVFRVLGRHQKKATSLMDDSASINEMARKNLERSAELHEESIEMTRQILEVQKANQALLAQIRDNTSR